MTEFGDIKYKDSSPLQTIHRIRRILDGLDIVIKEQWKNAIEGYYSVNVRIFGTNLCTNGKGASPEFALASGYGELMERLQNLGMKSIGIDASPDALNYRSFNFAPDEKRLSVEEIADMTGNWVDVFTGGAITKAERIKILNSWLFETNMGKPADFVSVPYLRVNDGEICYIPELMIEACYGTNGMCAGNTREEALVQGLSEIAERYVNLKIVREHLTPPTIPNDYLKKYPHIVKMIEDITKKGNFRIVVKDCSLGKGFPVVGIIFLDMDIQRYYIKFGSHPVFEIALERCLTELFQGRTLENRSWLADFSYYSSGTDVFHNEISILKTGEGHYPVELFESEFSYGYSEPEELHGTNNRQMLSNMLKLFNSKGWDILIRDVSFLGFPSFNIIVPGISESYSPISKVIEINAWNKEVNRIARNIHYASDDQLKKLLRFVYSYYYTPSATLADFADIPVKSTFPWKSIRRDMILSAAYYRLGKLKQAYEVLDRFISEYGKNVSNPEITYYKCVRDYIGARADGINENEIRFLMGSLYPRKIIDKVISDMNDRSQAFQKCDRLECYSCNKCSLKAHCYYPSIKSLHIRLKERYAGNAINQVKNRDLFNEMLKAT